LTSTYGHDAFLVEVMEQTTLIKHFLDKTFKKYLVAGKHGS
jgi:homoserine O-acetyltransferase